MSGLTPPSLQSHILYHVESYVNACSLDWHSSSLFIHFNLIISLLSQTYLTSSLRDFTFVCILRQQTAQDTLISKPCPPSERCVCSRRLSVDSRLPSVQSRGRLRRSWYKIDKSQDKSQDIAHGKDSGRRACLDQEKAPKKYVQTTVSGDQDTSYTNHEYWKRQEPSGRA